MRPLPAVAYPNPVTFHARVRPDPVSDRGAPVPTWDPVGVDMMASVQMTSVTRVEPDGTVTSETRGDVLTQADPGAGEGDRFVWKGRYLVAQGPAIDEGGVGDVVGYTTNCLEVSGDDT